MKKIILCASLLSIAIAHAQENEKTIDEVHIQGKFIQTPYKNVAENIEVITAREIALTPARSIDEVLQQIPGLDIRRRGPNGVQSDVTLRGSSFEQVMILVNGIRMNDSQTGHNSMNIPVDLANVERIEIIKGPAAVRFGNNAYAGVINIITKPEAEENVKIFAEGGDFSTHKLGMNATFGSGRLSNLFQITRGGSEGYRHNTDYAVSNVFYQNKFSLKNGSVGLQAGFSEKKFGANGFYASAAATEQYEEAQASVVALKHEQSIGNFAFNSNVYWRRGQDMYLFNRQKPEIYRNMHIGNNIGGEVNGTYRSPLGTTGLGVELKKEFLASNNLGHRERFITQLFFMHHISLMNDRLQITPGISWADFSEQGNFFYPGLDVGFHFNEYHKLYGNIAKVHRIPTFTDLYYLSKTEKGNAALQPEHALSAEVGYRFAATKSIFKISGFMRNTDNAIDWVKIPQNTLWNAMNVGKIETKGLEAEAEHRVSDWLKLFAGYTYLDSSYKNTGNSSSKYVAEHLRHQVIGRAQFSFLKYFSNELAYRYQERFTTGSYHLLDEKLSFRRNQLGIDLTINNLTNTKYTEAFGVPMPGRWFSLGISYTSLN